MTASQVPFSDIVMMTVVAETVLRSLTFPRGMWEIGNEGEITMYSVRQKITGVSN